MRHFDLNSLYSNSSSFRQFSRAISRFWRLLLVLSLVLPCLFLFPEPAGAQTEDSEVAVNSIQGTPAIGGSAEALRVGVITSKTDNSTANKKTSIFSH